MDTSAQHLLSEFHDCDRELLDNEPELRLLMIQAAEAAGATVVAEVFHRYRPQGVTGVVVIEESHLSLHTWPEAGYAAVDFYTCGGCDPQAAQELLARGLGAGRVESLGVLRGRQGAGASIRLAASSS